MKCPEFSELMLMLDGELSGERLSRVRSHLAQCSVCKAVLEQQKRMEKVWRDSWTDPEEERFSEMRSRLLGAVPWWRRQVTWYAVAAVFAIYLGVKIFHFDRVARPLSEYAVEETFSAPRADESREEDLSPGEVDDITVSESTGEMAETAAAEPEQSEEVIEEAEASEEEELTESAGFISQEQTSSEFAYGLGGMAGEEAEILLRDNGESFEPVIEDFAVSQSESAESQDASSGVMTGAGGGGTALGGTASSASRTTAGEGETEQNLQEDLPAPEGSLECISTAAFCDTDDSLAAGQDAERKCCYEISLTLPSDLSPAVSEVMMDTCAGESLVLERSDWNELFILVDSLFVGDPLFLQVDSSGTVTGSGLDAGVRLPLPDPDYLGSSISVIPR